MRKSPLTKSRQKFIRENYLLVSGAAMAERFGCTKGVVYRYMKANGLVVPSETALKFRIDAINKRLEGKEHPLDEIIIKEYLVTPIKQLAKNINKSSTYVIARLKHLGLVIPPEIIEKRKSDSKRKPGCKPFNKGLKQSDFMTKEGIERTVATRFKKGGLPHNSVGVKDGDISIRKDTSGSVYKWIRVSLGYWKMYPVYLWEQTHGEIPPGHIVVFKDKNSLNTVIENLECITREELMLRNSIHKYPEEIKKTIKIISSITRQINKYEKQD